MNTRRACAGCADLGLAAVLAVLALAGVAVASPIDGSPVGGYVAALLAIGRRRWRLRPLCWQSTGSRAALAAVRAGRTAGRRAA